MLKYEHTHNDVKLRSKEYNCYESENVSNGEKNDRI